ncbi:MAG: preprotein translocase subunit YajC [Thermoguttaceae bacterium]|nr:preprotein translocase subunit YajC [Thermoguttaceae bacterium]
MPLCTLITLLAQAESAAPSTPGKPAGAVNAMFMIFMVLIAMYLLFVLPKRSQAKQTQKMIDSLNKNDRVMTNSGIIGLVHSIDKEGGEIVLKVDESNNTKIRFSIGAVY